MRTGFVIASLLGLSMGAVASAQPAATPTDTAAIKKCLESSNDSLGHKCIGLVAHPCTKAADGDPAKTKACAARELTVWEAQMEAALRRIRAGGFREMKDDVAR